MNNQVKKNKIYNKILLKLSGEALAGNQKYGIDETQIDFFAQEIKKIVELNVKVGIVVGGGNIFRGLKGINLGVDKIKGDYMGMLATIINSLALSSFLSHKKIPNKVLTSTFMEPYAERYSPEKAVKYLSDGYVVIFGGGTSNPFFTTDSAAALKAIEIGADVLLKGTNVDGVYSDNPKTNPNAIKYDTIDFKTAIEKNLKVMDLTAFALCYENNMPIIVYDVRQKDNLKRIIIGEKIGTLVQ